MKKKDILNRLYAGGMLSHLDIHFAGFMTRLAGGVHPELALAAALVSSFTREGHICLDLSTVAGKRLLEEEDGNNVLVCPGLKVWRNKLIESPVVGSPGQYKPLILDNKSRLYLFRYWDYQERLADLIRRRVSEKREDMAVPRLRERMDKRFPGDGTGQVDWQKVAAFTALAQMFCVISGGPGTGKTTTIAKIIVLLLEEASPRELRVALAAPTGKGAARLQESITIAKKKLDLSDPIKDAIPGEASTIHRLLGPISDSPYFRYNAQNRLPVDAVVVDEASMVDLALMSKLIQALPLPARLILLGDKDQLASVEAGAVLGDICDTGNVHDFSKSFCRRLRKATGYSVQTHPNGEDAPGIQDCIVQLRKSYRFGSDSGIGAVSQAVNAGDGGLALSLLKGGDCSDIEWKESPMPNTLARAMKDTVIEGFGDYLRAASGPEIYQEFDRFRILCALRKGPYGVAAVNSLVEQILKEERLIELDGKWYKGRPVLITSNDYNLSLFNGDVGIALPAPEVNNELRVFFPAAHGAPRKLHPLRLPEHETVYAMTVHKSQGSEFDKVLLLLPDRDSPVLTRELIYTGITRAKEGVNIWGVEGVFRTAVSRRTERTSGLRDSLWES